MVSLGAIRALDLGANENALIAKHARAWLAVVLIPRGRVAIVTVFATRAIGADRVVLTETVACVRVAFVGVVVTFAANTSYVK